MPSRYFLPPFQGAFWGNHHPGFPKNLWDRWDNWDEWDRWDNWDVWDNWDNWDEWDRWDVWDVWDEAIENHRPIYPSRQVKDIVPQNITSGPVEVSSLKTAVKKPYKKLI